jgi:hypothetical protein
MFVHSQHDEGNSCILGSYPAAETCIMRSVALRNAAFSSPSIDGIQVGRIGRQIKKLRTYRFYRLPNAGDFMHGQIIHDHDIVALDRWSTGLLDLGKKHRPIDRPINNEGASLKAGSAPPTTDAGWTADHLSACTTRSTLARITPCDPL